MDLNGSNSLAAVENLFEEFFSPFTTNIRKHEIEAQLSAIKNFPNLGKLCLYFITNTSSQYVSMFALQILESEINHEWSKIDWSTQEEIKSLLQTNLIMKTNNSTNFLRNKYAKLLVDIAKIDWPIRYPNFFDNILELLKSDESNQLIGLIILKTVCEEFMSLNATFENLTRKKEITRLLNGYIPIVFEILTNILENISTKSKHTATTTPPPSPTHHNQLLGNQVSPANQISCADFRPDGKIIGQEALLTIQFIFSWISIELIPRKLIKAIFSFTNFSTYSKDDDDLCVSAISTVNEIYYRKCCPPGTESFFREIYSHVVELLRNITISTYRIESTDEIFVKKLSELLVLIIEQHLWRFEQHPSFSSLDFLSMFFQYTMHLPNIRCFLNCLSVWSTFFKQIKILNNAQKYSEVFLGLSSALLKKIQFTYNFTQLIEVNTIDRDDDNKTEWQYLINASVQIISQAALFAPLELFNQISNTWNLFNSQYKELEHYSEMESDSTTSNAETEKLAYILRDFSTLTFTLANLAHHFYLSENEDIFKTATPIIYNLMEQTLKSASSYCKVKTYVFRCNNQKLVEGFIEVHSELLAALRTWMICMESKHQQPSWANPDIFLKLLLPILKEPENVSTQLSSSAALLFLELAKKPNNLCPLRYPEVAYFIQQVPRLKYESQCVGDTINAAISEILIKHLKSYDRETLQKYKLLISIFFDGITRDFRSVLKPNSLEANIEVIVNAVLPALSNLIEYCRNYPLIAKKHFVSALKPTLDHALFLFPNYVKYSHVYETFSKFFKSVLKNLQSQVGMEFTQNAVQVFLQVAASEQKSPNIAWMQQLLEIFSMVINETLHKTLLPEILQLCMENIYPLLLPQAAEFPDIFITFLDLLYTIIHLHWSHFYNSHVMMGFSPGCNENEIGPDIPKRPEQLLAVLKVFGEGLMQDDINIFRQSLIGLQQLNHHKKIYHKGIFRTHLLSEVLRVLLNTLLYKRQELFNEDIICAVFAMAEVDFDGFLSTFLPQFIQNLDGLNANCYEKLASHFNSSNDKDYPSFMQHLQEFAVDFQHIMCNRT